MRGQDAAASVPGSVSRCRKGPERRPARSKRPSTVSRPRCTQQTRPGHAPCTGPGRAQRGRSGLQGERGPSRGAAVLRVLWAVQSWEPAVLLTPGPGPRPGSLDSEILVKVSKLPVHSLDVPAETRRPWGRGARSFFACDLVTLGGPGCPLGSRSPRGCQGLRETECSCVVSSKAPPGGSYVNGGSW